MSLLNSDDRNLREENRARTSWQLVDWALEMAIWSGVAWSQAAEAVVPCAHSLCIVICDTSGWYLEFLRKYLEAGNTLLEELIVEPSCRTQQPQS